MKYTKEQHLAHVAAWWDGKLECRHHSLRQDWEKSDHIPDPNRTTEIEYRIRPEPRLRPWKPEEGVGKIVRGKHYRYITTALGFNNDMFMLADGSGSLSNCTPARLLEQYEQLDGSPCGVEEQS